MTKEGDKHHGKETKSSLIGYIVNILKGEAPSVPRQGVSRGRISLIHYSSTKNTVTIFFESSRPPIKVSTRRETVSNKLLLTLPIDPSEWSENTIGWGQLAKPISGLGKKSLERILLSLNEAIGAPQRITPFHGIKYFDPNRVVIQKLQSFLTNLRVSCPNSPLLQPVTEVLAPHYVFPDEMN